MKKKSWIDPELSRMNDAFSVLGTVEGEKKGQQTQGREQKSDEVQTCGLAKEIYVRLEKQGRGGKVVSCVRVKGYSNLESLAQLARSFRKLLGTGGGIEDGEVIVLQGDCRERLEEWCLLNGVSYRG